MTNLLTKTKFEEQLEEQLTELKNRIKVLEEIIIKHLSGQDFIISLDDESRPIINKKIELK